MKDSTRSILRYSRDILIILIVLVVLARTGNMPVIVPDRVTDFIVDTTEDLFSGRAFSSFGGFLSDIGDFFLRGGTDRQNRKALSRYRDRVEQYLERSKRNLLYLAAHPDIRRSLPDFHAVFGTMYAKAVLENMLTDCYDLDQMTVYSGNGAVIASVVRDGSRPLETGRAVSTLLARVKKLRGVLVFTSTDGRIIMATSFASRMRERFGLLLMVLNDRGIAGLFPRKKGESPYHLFLTDSTGKFYVPGNNGNAFTDEFDTAYRAGKFVPALLREEKFVRQKSGTRRLYMRTLAIDNVVGEIYIGLLGPEGNILSFILLILRLALLIGVLVLLLYLIRRILSLTREILRSRRLSRRLLELSLEKSLAAGSKAGTAARKAVDVSRNSMESMELIAKKLKEEPKNVMVLGNAVQPAAPATAMENGPATASPEPAPEDALSLDPETYPENG